MNTGAGRVLGSTVLGDGNDQYTGGVASDQAFGGNGNDTFRGKGGGDFFDGGTGIDTVFFDDHFGNFSRGWTISLAANTASTRQTVGGVVTTETDAPVAVENVVASAGNDIITGNGSNNFVNGGAGNDTFSFADHFGVSQRGWSINMVTGKATTLRTTGTFVLFETDTFSNIENVTGSAVADSIIGNGAGNILSGGLGADTLTGGLGADHFRYNARTEGRDAVTDFSADDFFDFRSTTFGNVARGILSTSAPGAFAANATGVATQADDRFIFETRDGTLWFDANGNAAGGAVEIAIVGAGHTVTAADILIF